MDRPPITQSSDGIHASLMGDYYFEARNQLPVAPLSWGRWLWKMMNRDITYVWRLSWFRYRKWRQA